MALAGSEREMTGPFLDPRARLRTRSLEDGFSMRFLFVLSSSRIRESGKVCKMDFKLALDQALRISCPCQGAYIQTVNKKEDVSLYRIDLGNWGPRGRM